MTEKPDFNTHVLTTGFLVLKSRGFCWHDVFRMIGAEGKRDRIKLMIRRTMLAVRRSRELVQQTNELLKQCQLVSSPIKIKHVDHSHRPELLRKN